MEKCKICGSFLSNKVLEYKNVPKSAQGFLTMEQIEEDKGIDISVYECPYCKLIQLAGEPVSYYKDVIRATGFSEEMKNFRNNYFNEFANKYRLNGKKIIEIGAGTGEYLKMFESATNLKAFGLENNPESVQKALQQGLNVYQGFIQDAEYKIENGPYDAFFIMNFLEHIPNPKEFLRGLYHNLTDNAVGIIEVPNSDIMLSKGLYGEFVQDHVSYFTRETLELLVRLSGFEIKDMNIIWNNDIIAMEVIKKQSNSFDCFNRNYQTVDMQFNQYTMERKNKGKIVVWGAGHQALTQLALLHQKDSIAYIIDSADFKQEKYAPVTHIPIVSPNILKDDVNIKTIIIMAEGYFNEIYQYIEKNYNLNDIEISGLRRNQIEIVKKGV